MNGPLSRADIAARIPHAGRMVLLDEVVSWDADRIVCRTGTHRDPDHPLAIAGRLSAVHGVEYAAQAMAVHGTLLDPPAAGGAPKVGFLASVRNVRMTVDRLDDVAEALTVEAMRESGDGNRVLYDFRVSRGDDVLVSGRAAVVLDAEGSLLA